ncbi:MAG: hypothetical protein IIB95_13915 [Candidatus Marinimicrobia bacterium]|nr:hypothetical protein [Candidatus Neomarinimicrobiota bacterium]
MANVHVSNKLEVIKIKDILIIIVFVLVMSSCYTQLEELNYAKEVSTNDALINFSILMPDTISIDGKNIEIKLYFKNISKESIIMAVPECFGINIYPVLIDSKGKVQTIQFRLRTSCDGNTFILEPNQDKIFDFNYYFYECYTLYEPGYYRFHFEYMSHISNTNGEIISHRLVSFSKVKDILLVK